MVPPKAKSTTQSYQDLLATTLRDKPPVPFNKEHGWGTVQ